MPINRHKIAYQVLNRHEDLHYPPEFEVHATPEELQDFAASGYLIRKRLFQGEALTRLQEATDTLEAAEWDRHRKNRPKDRSWGIILRHLMDKDPVFLELLKYSPVLSVCRALMGTISPAARPDRPHQLSWRRSTRNELAPAYARRQQTATALVFAAARHRCADLSRRH